MNQNRSFAKENVHFVFLSSSVKSNFFTKIELNQLKTNYSSIKLSIRIPLWLVSILIVCMIYNSWQLENCEQRVTSSNRHLDDSSDDRPSTEKKSKDVAKFWSNWRKTSFSQRCQTFVLNSDYEVWKMQEVCCFIRIQKSEKTTKVKLSVFLLLKESSTR